MTTKTIETSIGSIPNPSNWIDNSKVPDDSQILFLEKAIDGRTTVGHIKKALNEYKRLYKAGIASPAEILTLARAYPENEVYTSAVQKMDLEDSDVLVVGGPASVEMVDREGHLITTDALEQAFQKYMANFRTRNVMVLHSDVQVGHGLPAYISKGGQIFKSGVDDEGESLFFISELRNDTKIAKKVAEQVRDGKLKSYSIAGSAIKTQTIQKGLQQVMQVDELELAEITVCEKGVNQGASFDILKAENSATKSCADGSCLIKDDSPCDCGCNSNEGVQLMYKSDGDVDFMSSFKNFMKKEEPSTLKNIEGRQSAHAQFLAEYGFPQEVDQEVVTNTPVVEYDPLHLSPPWVVNEGGQDVSTQKDSDVVDALSDIKTLSQLANEESSAMFTVQGHTSEIVLEDIKDDIIDVIKLELRKQEMPKGAVYSSKMKPPEGAQVYRTARGTEYWVPSKKDKEETADSSRGISPDSAIGRDIQNKTMAAGMESLIAGMKAFKEAGGHDNKTAALKAARKASDAVTKKFEKTTGIDFKPENIDEYYKEFDRLVSMSGREKELKSERKKELNDAMDTFDRNEDNNYHSENGKLLADLFGTDEQQKKMNEILDRHKNSSTGISYEDQKWRDENIIRPYYQRLVRATKPKQAKPKASKDMYGAIKEYLESDPEYDGYSGNKLSEVISRLNIDMPGKPGSPEYEEAEDMYRAMINRIDGEHIKSKHRPKR